MVSYFVAKWSYPGEIKKQKRTHNGHKCVCTCVFACMSQWSREEKDGEDKAWNNRDAMPCHFAPFNHSF